MSGIEEANKIVMLFLCGALPSVVLIGAACAWYQSRREPRLGFCTCNHGRSLHNRSMGACRKGLLFKCDCDVYVESTNGKTIEEITGVKHLEEWV